MKESTKWSIAYVFVALLIAVACGTLVGGLATWFSTPAESTPTPKVVRYEYMIEAVAQSDCPDDYIRCINNRAKDGWRLHTVDIKLGAAIYEREER